MRVLMPNGTLVAVEKAIPAAEMRISFNGREMRFSERTTEIASANALGLFLKAQVCDNFGTATQDFAFIGNLPNEFVKGVLTSLVQQGYADLSDLKLQKTQLMAAGYKFDNGVSAAYLLNGFEASASCADPLGNPFMCGAFPAASEAEDAEDDEDTGEEDCADE